MTKQEFLDTLLAANETSIEVLKVLVDQIDEPSAPKEDVLVLTKDTFRNLVQEIVENIISIDVDVVEDYELSLSYNELCLENVTLSKRMVQNAVEDALESYIDVVDED